MTRGIYKITGPNGYSYIGRSTWIERRWFLHIEDLKAKKHHNYKLQGVYNRYGINAFKFSIVEVCARKVNLKTREASYIHQHMRKCYNVKKETEHFRKIDFIKIAKVQPRKRLKLSRHL